MLRRARFFVLIVVALGFPATIFAASPWYVSFDYGYSSLAKSDNPYISATSDRGYQGILGYQLNKNFSVEAAYTDFGTFNEAPFYAMSVKALALQAVANYPLTDNWSLFGKLGIVRGKVDTSLFYMSSGTDFEVGVGAGLKDQLTENWSVEAQWTRYPLRIAQYFGKPDYDLISLGASYYF